MIKKTHRSKFLPMALLAVMTLALCGGCTPIGEGDSQAFVTDMLIRAAAAFLL